MNFYITQYSSTYRLPRIRAKSNILADRSLTTENLLTQKLKADYNTWAHYKPYELPNGTESLPPNINNQTSGFFRERAVHIPNSFVPLVNVSTTYGSNFVKPARTEPVILRQVGPKESSGFISNTETEPISTTVGERWHCRSRPIGATEYKDKFPHYNYPK
ncbi:unnamed protein product, partial [Rotaria sordida]